MHMPSAALVPREDSRPAVAAPGAALVYTADQAAALIGGTCKASWLRKQAREKKIPCRKIGGAYNFTDADIAEILAIVEQRPAEKAAPVQVKAAKPRAGARPAEASLPTGVTQLRARQPRTMPRRLQASA